jgi:hypothetical protein
MREHSAILGGGQKTDGGKKNRSLEHAIPKASHLPNGCPSRTFELGEATPSFHFCRRFFSSKQVMPGEKRTGMLGTASNSQAELLRGS